MASDKQQAIHVQVVFDIICPWCFIGKRNLDKALNVLQDKGVAVQVEWRPFQLNPTLPKAGMDRKTFRSARFGSWEAAVAMDSRAMAAGSAVGAVFRYDLQARTSHTLAGHLLVRQALVEGGAALQSRVVEALFVAYFSEGQDIGDDAVLEKIAAASGMAPGAVTRSLSRLADVQADERQARAQGLNSVPGLIINGSPVTSGAHDALAYVRMILSAAEDGAPAVV